MEHRGQVQHGGKESGEPWRPAVCQIGEDKVAILVNGIEILSYPREDVEVESEGTMYRIAGEQGTVFFAPDNFEVFRLDWENPDDVGTRIELAAASTPARGPAGTRSKVTAGVLGILLGGFGAHKFYLGDTGMGILYLVFFWTGIPLIIGFIEGIIYLTMTDEAFAQKYG